jgi:type VI secretion system protein ImpJ
MRDGTRLCLQGPPPKSNSSLAPRDFAEILRAYGQDLGVYLGVKPVLWVEPLYTHYACRVMESEITDLFAADNARTVSYLVYDAQLVFEPELEQYREWTLCKIAMVQRSASDTGFQLADHYIFPCRSLQTSATLMTMLEPVRDLLWRKARSLEGYKQQSGSRLRGMGRQDVLYIPMMQAVNRYLQMMQHALTAAATHPHEMYGILGQLVAELSSFVEDWSVLDHPVPPYQHDGLWECFAPTIQLATQLLHRLTPGSAHEVQLVFDSESKRYTAALNDEFFAPHSLYYLAIKTDMATAALDQVLREKCKISAWQDMDRLVRDSLRGVDGELTVPPQDLPYLAHYTYVKLNHRHYLWPNIVLHTNLVVDCGEDALPAGTEMRLYGVPATEG